MRVLLLETDRRGVDAAAHALQQAGHEVVRCHEPDLGSFPCNALCADGSCPLEDERGVDVALTVRTHAYPRPTAYEDGISCALRKGVPLVVGGVTAMNPFDRWTTAIVTNVDVVEGVETAAAMPIARLADPARAELRRRLADDPVLAGAVDVEVYRRGRRLAVSILLPDEAGAVDGELAVAVAGVLRAHDQWSTRIDVAVERRGSVEPTA